MVSSGAAKDVRRFLNEFPWLIDDDHTQCWALGAQARANGLVCLIAPSARDRPRGTTVPVFVSGAVSQGGYDGEVTFFIPAAGPVRFRTKFTEKFRILADIARDPPRVVADRRGRPV